MVLVTVRLAAAKIPVSSICTRFAYKKPFSPNMVDPKDELIRQERHANLGKTVEMLRILVPEMATTSLPKSIISPDVILQFCPAHLEEINSYIPAIKGHVPYYGSCKLLQVLLSSLVGQNAKLHIQAIRPIMGWDSLVGSTDNMLPYTLVPEANKILIRWSTSLMLQDGEACGNEKHRNVENSGSHGWEKMDTSSFRSQNGKFLGIASTLSKFRASVKESKHTERVVSGIFVFELNEDNDQIIVHTIEDIDVLEKREPLPVLPVFTAC